MARLSSPLLSRLRRRLHRLVREGFVWRRPGFRTTTEGKVFILVTFLIGFAAYNTATNLLYLIFSMMLALIIVSAHMSRSALVDITVERFVPTHLVAGEEATIHLTIRNAKRVFPSLSLRVADVLAAGTVAGQAYAVRVPARGTLRTSYRVTFGRRGAWEFSRLVVATRYPFGFIEKSISVTLRQEVLVFPAVAPLGSEFTDARLDLGEVETGRRGLGTSLHGLRSYTPGDPARHIHWKVTAKAQETVVREFEREDKKRVSIVLDNAAPAADAEAFEWAVIFAASLCNHLILRDYQVQLVTRQGRVPFSTGTSHLHRLLRSLAIVELMGEAQAPPLAFHPAHAGDATNLYLRYRDTAVPPGYDRAIDTRPWRPEGVAPAPLAQAA